MANIQSPIELFGETKKKFDVLSERRAAVKANLEATRRQYLEACDDAKKEFGTADVGELRTLYRNRETENAQQATEFAQAVAELELELADIEQKAA